ncbi:hypothetical protein SpCBS45565_g07643 [Spizellomyces sp. 'palustris']|nr:hypothetical protein SpCBS45565_g07643 [Spizellomyces sp. 'palustris']
MYCPPITKRPGEECESTAISPSRPFVSDVLKTAFLAEYSSRYNLRIESLRPIEYPHLKNQIYLDHAGATPYPASVVSKHTSDLLSGTIFGNPHSAGSPSSSTTQERINAIRGQVLRYLNADPEEYAVIFTSGATAAARIVGDSIDWEGTNRAGEYWYLKESHTSVVGIRGLVESADGTDGSDGGTAGDNLRKRNGRARALAASTIERYLAFDSENDGARLSMPSIDGAFNLVALPAQCNATGIRYPLDYINKFQRKNRKRSRSASPIVSPPPHASTHSSSRSSPMHLEDNALPFLTLLDAASYLSTASLDLSSYPSDFTILSFYKIFGFPTGLGALIMRRDAARFLRKRYYGGGTLSAITVSEEESGWHVPSEDVSSRFEDGTLPFLEILALERGFEFIDGLGGMSVIGGHAMALRDFVYKQMTELRYDSGSPLCVIYQSAMHECGLAKKMQGPIINFNLRAMNGYVVNPTSVLQLASVHNIHMRAGCFCNPGACQSNLSLSSANVQRNFAFYGVVCGGVHDIIDGKPTGSLRISFGACSTFDDCAKWIAFLLKFYIEPSQSLPLRTYTTTGAGLDDIRVDTITVYPIKSCAGYSPQSWPIGSTGLFLDREWTLVDATNKPLTLKRYPKLAHIQILEIDLIQHFLVVQAGTQPPVQIHFGNEDSSRFSGETSVCTIRRQTIPYSNQVSQEIHTYFSSFLNIECRLVRRSQTIPSTHSFANQSHFLISSSPSFTDLLSRISPPDRTMIKSDRLRANITITSCPPYIEDTFVTKSLLIANMVCLRVLDLCTRCQIVNVDPPTALVGREPYSTLAKYRNVKGKGVCFGVLAGLVSGKGVFVNAGDRVLVV